MGGRPLGGALAGVQLPRHPGRGRRQPQQRRLAAGQCAAAAARLLFQHEPEGRPRRFRGRALGAPRATARVWPIRLKVKLEEHRAAACGSAHRRRRRRHRGHGRARLVNSFGEVFQANLGDVEDEDPARAGPARPAAPARCWRCGARCQPAAEKLGESIDRWNLSGRGSWRAELGSGAVIELGRGSDAEVVAALQPTLRRAPITQVTATLPQPAAVRRPAPRRRLCGQAARRDDAHAGSNTREIEKR